PPQEDNLTLVVSVSDGVNAPVECTVELSFTNQGPTITCPAGPVTISTGDTKTQTVVTNDDCDALTVSVISAIDPGDVVNVVGNAISYTPAGDARLVTMTVEVSDGLETATCDITWDVITTAPYIVQIEKDEGPDGIGAIQGQFTDVTVTLNSFLASSGDDVYGVGAFDLLIAYDQSVLGFQQAIEGDIYDDCGWEYFTYRFGPDGNCGNACPSGMTRVVGIAETNNGPYHPGCLPDYVDVAPKDLFDLRFLVSNDRTFECQYAPVRFFWIDCGDNTLSNADGTELYISSKVFDFDNAIPVNNGTVGFPTFQGAQDICLIAEVQKDPPIRNIDFINGGVDIACADSIDARGDINLNGLAYEIADAVMFTNYFISGLGAFEYVDGSIAASDANADGIPLSVADLVYLIRVVVGDALPYPKVNPTVAKYTVEGAVHTDIELGAALIVFEGDVTPTNLSGLDMVYGQVEGNTHVLLYSTEANATASGDLVTANGTVLKLEGATYDGQPVNFDLVPGSFRVEQNYPNPFNPTTIITFQAPGVSEATVTIYNAIGQKVDQMTVQTSNGFGEVSWDASDMSSGIYFYKVVAGQYTATKKAILLK
ncbi:MAG: T9SS type A sorting domain-containing protein, partial [candidate division Zixibacteria bacterium]|nr:T9SS type A sorting domain-containing protein [candidate division Zixibacteria bacterium]